MSPQLLGGRVEFAGAYAFTPAGAGQFRRRYSGTVTANVPLLSGKIERGILAEFEQTLPVMAACTQRWLDAQRATP